MNEFSVNISGRERQQIEFKAIELFLKTAKARHPDENFYKNLTKRIYEDALEDFMQYANSPLHKQLNYITKYTLPNHLSRLRLPNNLYILTLCSTDRSYSRMMDRNINLALVDIDNLIIQSEHKHEDKVLFPFSAYGENQLRISQQIEIEINEYNDKMTEVYEDLDKQLKALVSVIEQCKTTKAFYAKLPNLTSLFPNSLCMKISRKNDIGEVELTEEQKLMQDATNSIATANLLGD